MSAEDFSFMDPCECGHAYTDHSSDGEECNVLGCECKSYMADTSWTDDLDELDLEDEAPPQV